MSYTTNVQLSSGKRTEIRQGSALSLRLVPDQPNGNEEVTVIINLKNEN